MAENGSKTALVTGANKGIGFEICRQLAQKNIHVIMGCRDQAKGEDAVKQHTSEGLSAELAIINVTEDASIQAAVKQIIKAHNRIDILVNNAGILIDWQDGALTIKIDQLRQTLETNFYGALRMIQAVLPHMQESGYGRIVNLSSTMGSLSYNSSGGGSSAPAYRLSKTALNGLTAIFANDLTGSDIKINSVCPGWVRTDMGGSSASRSVEQGADTAVWLATLPKDGPNGGFFKDRQSREW